MINQSDYIMEHLNRRLDTIRDMVLGCDAEKIPISLLDDILKETRDRTPPEEETSCYCGKVTKMAPPGTNFSCGGPNCFPF